MTRRDEYYTLYLQEHGQVRKSRGEKKFCFFFFVEKMLNKKEGKSSGRGGCIHFSFNREKVPSNLEKVLSP